ncbi:MAG: ribbon-helix-helix domain-containing protein [Candidatus Micrarchaeia archaeon]
MQNNESGRITVRLDDYLYEKLNELSIKTGKNLSTLLKSALRQSAQSAGYINDAKISSDESLKRFEHRVTIRLNKKDMEILRLLSEKTENTSDAIRLALYRFVEEFEKQVLIIKISGNNLKYKQLADFIQAALKNTNGGIEITIKNTLEQKEQAKKTLEELKKLKEIANKEGIEQVKFYLKKKGQESM